MYNERDFKKSIKYNDDTVVGDFVYDDNGNLITRPTLETSGFSRIVQSFTYDERNRLRTMRWSDALDWSDFGYDATGRLAYANNPISSVTRRYDVAGRLITDQQEIAPVLYPLGTPFHPEPVVTSVLAHSNQGAHALRLPLTGKAGSSAEPTQTTLSL